MIAGEGRKRTAMILLCALFFSAGFLSMVRAEGKGSPLLAAVEETGSAVQSFEGLVVHASYKTDRWDLTVRTAEEKVLVRLDASEEDRLAVCGMTGRICRFAGPVRAPDGRRNFGCFDYALYLKGRDIRCLCEVSRYRAEAGDLRYRLLHGLAESKARFFDRIAPFLDREVFSLLAGLLFGEKGYLEEDVYTSFQRNGIAHVLAVSGLHVGLVYAVVLKLMRGRRNKKTTAVSAAVLLCYVCLSGFSVSVLRASFMIGLHLLSFHLHRRYDLVSAASLAACIFLGVNPYQLFDSGFQLSYMAAYSLGVALPRMLLKATELADRYKKGWIDDAGKLLLPCIAVQLGMTPLTLFHFLIFSPVSLLLNPFAVTLAGLLLPAGLFLYLVQCFGIPLVTAAAAGPVSAFARLLLAVNGAGNALGGSYSMAAPPIGMLCLYYAMFFYWFSEGRAVLLRKGRQKTAALLCLSMSLASCLLPFAFGLGELLPWQRPVRDVVFVDVGQGDCIHIASQGCNVLVDGGGSALKNVGEGTVLPYLLKNGVSGLEMAVVTHPDQDHCKGIRELSQVMRIRTIVFPSVYENDPSIADGYRAERIVFAGRGDVIRMGDAVFRVIAPYRDGRVTANAEDRNETCIAGMLQTGGLKVLLTADMTDQTERWLLADGTPLAADLLKAAHHGSAYSSREDFVDAVGPRLAVISCGRNNSYGHPAERITAMFAEKKIPMLRTDVMGAVGVTVRKDGRLKIENADGTAGEIIPLHP
ncbi:MAG: DNA internalization-related competence protein ComEC/Rec2 [Firmicutes bacterium]|nr:DNA internalization-related competence protein ComEC/Rec2 [Bacillota bacterium]